MPTNIPKTATSNANIALLTEADVALMLNVEPRTIRLWRRTLGLPFLKITRKIIRFRQTDIDGWLARRRVQMEAA